MFYYSTQVILTDLRGISIFHAKRIRNWLKCLCDNYVRSKNRHYLQQNMCFNVILKYMEKRPYILPSANYKTPTLAPSVGSSAKLISTHTRSDIHSYSELKDLSNSDYKPTNMQISPLCVPSPNWVPCPSNKCSYRAKLVFHRSTYKLLRM